MRADQSASDGLQQFLSRCAVDNELACGNRHCDLCGLARVSVLLQWTLLGWLLPERNLL